MPAAPRRALEKLGLDAERLHLRCWLGQPDGSRRLAPPSVSGEWKDALRGRALSACGRYGEAAALLARAAETLPDEAVVRAWQGELALVLRDDALAVRELDAAARLDPSFCWTYVYRAAARLRAGNAAGAAADVATFERLNPSSPAGPALEAVLAAQSGSRDGATRALDEAFRRGKEPWLFALRGAMRSGWNDLEGARSDMDAALAAGASPWMLMQRALVVNRLGEFWNALEDLKAARAKLPKSPEPLLLEAAIHHDQASYEKAFKCLTAALKLEPRAETYGRRARVLFVQGRLAEAQRDLESAVRLAPGDAALAQQLIQLLIVRGYLPEARERLEAELPPGARDFWRGYLSCRAKKYSEARVSFERASADARASDPAFAAKARFYGWVARALEREPAAAPRAARPELFLIGLGYRHPYQVSLAALRALSSAEEIYCNLSDSSVGDFLGLFPAPFKAIVFRSSAQQAEISSRTVMRGFARARRVAMVTRGQPIVYGRLAYRLYQKAAARGIACRVPGSVTIFDNISALVEEAPAPADGLQIVDACDLARAGTSLPTVVYLPLSERLDAFVRELERRYPPEHPCYLLPGSGQNEFRARRLALRELEPALRRADPACTLFLPAKEGA